MRNSKLQKIGVVSDTHGVLHSKLIESLEGVDWIIHAGDVGDVSILKALRAIAPVSAVRGNHDRGMEFADLPEHDFVSMGEDSYAYVIHDLKEIQFDPWAGRCELVVSGHTHIPSCFVDRDVVFLNPGSAGIRRESEHTLTCAILVRVEPTWIVRFVDLENSEKCDWKLISVQRTKEDT